MGKHYRIVEHNNEYYYTIQFRYLWVFWGTLQIVESSCDYISGDSNNYLVDREFKSLEKAIDYIERLKSNSNSKKIIEKGII